MDALSRGSAGGRVGGAVKFKLGERCCVLKDGSRVGSGAFAVDPDFEFDAFVVLVVVVVNVKGFTFETVAAGTKGFTLRVDDFGGTANGFAAPPKVFPVVDLAVENALPKPAVKIGRAGGATLAEAELEPVRENAEIPLARDSAEVAWAAEGLLLCDLSSAAGESTAAPAGNRSNVRFVPHGQQSDRTDALLARCAP